MADYTNSTDYVSLRRLIEYHNNVVVPAIGDAFNDAGKVDDVGYLSSGNFTSFVQNKIATIPMASNNADGLLSSDDYTLLGSCVTGMTINVGSIALNNHTAAITIPNATSSTDGLLSKSGYDIINAAVTALSISASSGAAPGSWNKNGHNATLTLNVLSSSSGSTATGIISKSDYTTFTDKIGGVQLDGDEFPLSPSGGVVILPVATATSAGLMSADDYKALTDITALMGDKDEADNIVNNLYDVIQALDGFEEANGSILTYFNNRAKLTDEDDAGYRNTFTVFNTFNKSVDFNSLVTMEAHNLKIKVGTGGIGYEFLSSDGIGLQYKYGSQAGNIYTYHFPAQSVTLSGVYSWSGTDTSSPTNPVAKLAECPTISTTMFA